MQNATVTAMRAAAMRNERVGPFMQLMIPLSWSQALAHRRRRRYHVFPVGPASGLRGRANTMILKLFRRTPQEGTIACLYGTIVAQARLPAFYQIYGVPDTVNGRLEMIMLHTVLFLRRLEGEAGPIRVLGQEQFDRFCRDMEDSLREMGVAAVPRNMRRIGEAFYGRLGACGAALDSPHGEQLAA